MAGCSVLDINDYNGNYDDNGDKKTEPGPAFKEFPGELWAATGPKTMLGYNFKAPLDNQGSAGVITSWFSKRGSGDIEAWRIANDGKFVHACAIDTVGGVYSYFHKSGGIFKTYTWTSVPRGSW